ncbi:MAG: hypothetical protein P8M18_07405 [Woeseiaceae bacterium]|nr:hypothetical protein [Woeseiaceae bacterium]
MRTVANFPSAAVADRYGVTIGDQWLNAAQLATTRLETVYDADHLLDKLTIID